jgi:hypothetical protein
MHEIPGLLEKVVGVLATSVDGLKSDKLKARPDQGGWHTSVWFGAMWVDYLTTLQELQPTHWLPAPPDRRGSITDRRMGSAS